MKKKDWRDDPGWRYLADGISRRIFESKDRGCGVGRGYRIYHGHDGDEETFVLRWEGPMSTHSITMDRENALKIAEAILASHAFTWKEIKALRRHQEKQRAETAKRKEAGQCLLMPAIQMVIPRNEKWKSIEDAFKETP